MKKSYWVIFGIVLFILALIIVIGIFLLSNRADELDEGRIETARASYAGKIIRLV